MRRSLILAAAVLTLSACRTSRTAESAVSSRAEVHTQVALRRDSIYVTDSVSRQAVGDTVYLTRLRTIYRERLLRDTVQTQLRDSVVTVSETATKLSAWEQCKLKWGGRAIAALAALVVAAAFYYLPRWR